MSMQFEKPTLQEVENFMKEFIEQNKEKYFYSERLDLDPVIVAGDFYYYQESVSWCNPMSKPLPAWQPAAKHWILRAIVHKDIYEETIEESEDWKEYQKTSGDTFSDLWYEETSMEEAKLKRIADQILKLFDYELTPSDKVFLIKLILENERIKVINEYVKEEVQKALSQKEFTVMIKEKEQ